MPSEGEATMEYETIVIDVTDNGVATVTLNRPEVLNSFNRRMCEEFAQFWERARTDSAIRAIVLRATGDRAFCTGVDVTELLVEDDAFLDPEHPWNEGSDPGPQLSPRRNNVWKPVVAAVHGMCAGGAAYLIGECDIVICEPGATFFDPHVNYGLVAALEPIMLSYKMSRSAALRMALLGLHERMSADRALVSGLVTEIVPIGELHARAHQLAATIAALPPVAVQGTVKAFWQSLNLGRDQALSSALMFTQIGNPIATAGLDRSQAKRVEPHIY